MLQRSNYIIAPQFYALDGPIALGSLIANSMNPSMPLIKVDSDTLGRDYPRIKIQSHSGRDIARNELKTTIESLETSCFIQDP